MRSWGFRRLGLCPTSCVEPSYVQSFRRMLRRWFIVQLQKRYVNYETHFPAWGWADNASVHPFKRSCASFYQKCFLKHLLWNRFLWVWILLHTQVSSDGSSDGSYVTAACALRLSRASCYPVDPVSLCFFIVLSVSSFPLQLNFITLNISSVSSSVSHLRWSFSCRDSQHHFDPGSAHLSLRISSPVEQWRTQQSRTCLQISADECIQRSPSFPPPFLYSSPQLPVTCFYLPAPPTPNSDWQRQKVMNSSTEFNAFPVFRSSEKAFPSVMTSST